MKWLFIIIQRDEDDELDEALFDLDDMWGVCQVCGRVTDQMCNDCAVCGSSMCDRCGGFVVLSDSEEEGDDGLERDDEGNVWLCPRHDDLFD
jgi:RNA polymerase subunit RPABC4/transcription elongation factor Spt4